MILFQDLTNPPNLHMVNIHISSPTFDKIEKDSRVTVESVISFVGGTLGLFTGFSILSGIEIIYFLGKFLFRRIDRRRISRWCRNIFGSG